MSRSRRERANAGTRRRNRAGNLFGENGIQVLDGVEAAPVNGRHTGSSVRNATWLQRCCGLPETGILDLATWNMLTRTYELFISRSDLPGGYRQEPPLAQNPSQPLRNFPWEPWGRGG